MTKKHHFLLYGALTLALAAAVLTAVGCYAESRQNRLMLEDSYTRQQLQAQEHLQSMAVKLSKLPVASDMRTCVELLAGVSRQADEAADALSALQIGRAHV